MDRAVQSTMPHIKMAGENDDVVLRLGTMVEAKTYIEANFSHMYHVETTRNKKQERGGSIAAYSKDTQRTGIGQ